MEPLLLLAHKYGLTVPLHHCKDFLKRHFSSRTYSELLHSERLDCMLPWLAKTRQLQMDDMHAAIMACLADSLLQLNKPGNKLGDRRSFRPCAACFHSLEQGRHDEYYDDLGRCGYCDDYDPDEAPEHVRVFRQVWSTAARPTDQKMEVKQEVAAAMQQLTQAEAVELLQTLLAVRDYTRDSPVLRSYSDDED